MAAVLARGEGQHQLGSPPEGPRPTPVSPCGTRPSAGARGQLDSHVPRLQRQVFLSTWPAPPHPPPLHARALGTSPLPHPTHTPKITARRHQTRQAPALALCSPLPVHRVDGGNEGRAALGGLTGAPGASPCKGTPSGRGCVPAALVPTLEVSPRHCRMP